jgi:ComF family protein
MYFSFLKTIKTYFHDFLGLIYPELCAACQANLFQQEKVLCTKCLYNLPRTHFHKVPGNPIEQTFWGRVPIERGAAFYFFQKGSKYQQLLHLLKYNKRKDIGVELGRQYGADLVTEESFSEMDYIIPVPLHRKKLHKRGYNQSEMFGKGLAEFLPATLVTNNLYRKKYTETQTKKSRYERWENVEDVFGVRFPEKLEGKHVLLIDDVITTGATLEGCAQVLKNAADVKISIATMAFASLS